MFTSPQPAEPDQTETISIVVPAPTRRASLLRIIKPAIACSVIGTGAAALFVDADYVTADNAVVTAHVVSLRAPIEGVVRSRAGAVGEPIATGATLAEIDNPLVDERQLNMLRYELDRLRADIAAGSEARHGLESLFQTLSARAAHHRDAKVAQLSLDADRAIRDRAAKQDELEQLVRTMRRKMALTGSIPQSDIEQAQTAVRIGAAQVASLDQQVAAAQEAVHAAEKGILIEANGSNDVSYSEQRADEVQERLFDLNRGIASMQAEAEEIAGRLAAEATTVEHLRVAHVTVPSDGMIWRLGAAPGERVAPGDLLAQIVNCSDAFLAVAVPQNRLPDIDLGALSSFRLAGERLDRSGTIAGVTGDAAMRGDSSLAAVPATGSHPLAAVLVKVPASSNQVGSCLVGRTARVLLPTSGGWLDWILRSVRPRSPAGAAS